MGVLHFAGIFGDINIFNVLFEFLKNTNPLDLNFNLRGVLPLAASHGHLQFLQWFVKQFPQLLLENIAQLFEGAFEAATYANPQLFKKRPRDVYLEPITIQRYEEMVRWFASLGVEVKLNISDNGQILGYEYHSTLIQKETISEQNLSSGLNDQAIQEFIMLDDAVILQGLIKTGLDVQKYRSQHGETLLYWACKFNAKKIFLFLMQQPCDFLPNNEGWHPLHVAAINGHVELVQTMVEKYGCDINLATKVDNTTAIDIAIDQNNKALLECLLKHKASPATALRRAALRNNLTLFVVIFEFAQNDPVSKYKILLALIEGVGQRMPHLPNKDEKHTPASAWNLDCLRKFFLGSQHPRERKPAILLSDEILKFLLARLNKDEFKLLISLPLGEE